MKSYLFLLLIVANSSSQAMLYQLNELGSKQQEMITLDLESQLTINQINQTPSIDYPGVHIKQLVEKVDTLIKKDTSNKAEIKFLECDVRLEKCVTMTLLILALVQGVKLALA